MSTIATLVVGVDGSTTKNSNSTGITSVTDRAAFLARRKLVDCILIGGSTARNEPYQRTPVPLIILSRSTVNPVPNNSMSHLWNIAAPLAIVEAQKIFGANILVEGGIALINVLLQENLIDRLELSVTKAIGGENCIDYRALLAKFKYSECTTIADTEFYVAKN